MLGKLIKYEFKATYKFMLLLYAILLIVSLFTGLSYINEYSDVYELQVSEGASAALDAVRIFISFLFIAMMLVVITSVFFYSISRFYKEILGDGGYLYHTLPVKVHEHILARCITSVVWSIASYVAVFAAYMLMSVIMYSGLSEVFEIYKEFGTTLAYISKHILDFTLGLAMIIAGLFSLYFQIYASMAAGCSANKHRVLKSVGVFVLIMLADSLISSFVDRITIHYSYYSFAGTISFPYNGLDMSITGSNIVNLIASVAFSAVLFFVARYFLKNKLNLQ